MSGEINLYDSDQVLQRKIRVNDTTKRVEVQDATGSTIVDVESHASRHDIGGEDEIPGLASHAARHDIGGEDEIPTLRTHAHRHEYGGEDAISEDGLRFSQVKVVFGNDEVILSVGAGSSTVVPEGVYYVRCGANSSVQYTPDGGTSWYVVVETGKAGLVFSDGENVRVFNDGGVTEDTYLLPIE